MSEQHTPGPWIWWTSNGLHRLTAEGGRDGGVLSAVRLRDGFADIVVSEADARLIATSPKLLAASKQFIEAFEDLFGQCLSNGMKNAWGKDVDCTKLNLAASFASDAIAEATRSPK